MTTCPEKAKEEREQTADHYCEVIGCRSRACWILEYRLDIYCEDYLCSRHWNSLRICKPQRAGCYIHESCL